MSTFKTRILNKYRKKEEPVEPVETKSETRETWGSGLDFFFSALGYAG